MELLHKIRKVSDKIGTTNSPKKMPKKNSKRRKHTLDK
jgi:hypothetical protein